MQMLISMKKYTNRDREHRLLALLESVIRQHADADDACNLFIKSPQRICCAVNTHYGQLSIDGAADSERQ